MLLDKKYFYYTLVFFLIFAFPIVSVLNSVKVIFLYTICLLLLGVNTKGISSFILSFESSLFMFLYALFGFFTMIITIVTKSVDFSLYIKIVSSQVLMIIVYMFYSFLEDKIDIPKAIFIAFIVQSIVIFLCIVSESFYNLTAPFRLPLPDNLLHAYGRLRGNAISGYQFFGISTMYGFIIIWFFLNFNKKPFYLLSFCLICLAGVISGRYCVVSIGVGFLFLIYDFIKHKKIKFILKLIMGLVILIVCFVFVCYKISDKIENPVSKRIFDAYIMSPIESILKDKQLNTSSTDRLKEMYEFDLSDYYVKGSGSYTNPDGTYFGHVDIGWYRLILYYGINGCILLVVLFFYFVIVLKNSKNKELGLAFFLYFLLLNFKGDVQLYSNNIIPIVMGLLFFEKKELN